MVRVTVNNKRKCDRGVYVGRPTPLGNPYEIGPDGTREEVIELYEAWLEEEMDRGGPAMSMFVRLFDELCMRGSLELLCWCKPKPCHADVIKRFLLEAWNEKQRSQGS